MVLSKTSNRALGCKARDFALKGVDGKTYSLADVRGPKGTLVVLSAIIALTCERLSAALWQKPRRYARLA
jgi:peroxiredoxin